MVKYYGGYPNICLTSMIIDSHVMDVIKDSRDYGNKVEIFVKHLMIEKREYVALIV